MKGCLASFTVPGKPVGKNQRNAVNRAGAVYRTREADGWMEEVRLTGLRARRAAGWPADTLIPKRVRVTVRVYGSRHDAGAVLVLVKDALEGVFYDNDRIVCDGRGEPADPKGEPRTEIDVELLEVHTLAEVERIRTRREKALIARLKRKTG